MALSEVTALSVTAVLPISMLSLWNCQGPMREGVKQPQAWVWTAPWVCSQVRVLPTGAWCLSFFTQPKKIIIVPVWESCLGN